MEEDLDVDKFAMRLPRKRILRMINGHEFGRPSRLQILYNRYFRFCIILNNQSMLNRLPHEATEGKR